MPSERVQRQIDRLLDGAEDALIDRDWSRVRDLAQDALALDPDNEDARTFVEAAERSLPDSKSADGAEEASAPSQPAAPTDVSSSDSVPSSFADGRYVVQKFLGEGGKKKVYLAHDELLDRDVAFALIKTEGLDEVSRARISREAQAMGRLGSHPHIVTVFDLGEVDSSSTPTSRGQADPLGQAPVKQPFMVTELMGGGDVEAIVEDAPDHKLPLEQAISIAVETCRGLDFAHSKGIVHRDLKPGNVWLTSEGTAKIGDFGLAVAIDRSRLTQAGMMVGTVSYMPPEQAMGGETTPKADLYSLGAMLYEMVTGRPPFLGDDSVAIIGQHINTPPVAPTWHRSDCPRPLEALIMRLLAKDPSERPESASDVLTALEGIDLTPLESPLLKGGDSTVGEANVLDSLAGGVFVGRQAEMGQLKAALEDALGGKGRMVTLVGEPGIGKTRTAQELATYAGLRGCQVLWGRCYEEQGVPPYWPWVQAIRGYVRDTDPERLRSEMGAGAADIAEIVSDVKTQLPGLEPSPTLGPEEARFRLFDSIAAFLKSAGQRRPIVLVLDDLHWSDRPSLQLLQFLTRELSGARLLVIGTYRDVELTRQHPLTETLGDLTRERLFQRIMMQGLNERDVGRFIEVTSGLMPPQDLVSSVFTQTEGNPLFVTEVVRLLVQENLLTAERVNNGDSWSVRIPDGVREVIGRRLNRLSQRCNETLSIASVIGREFESDQLVPLIDDVSDDRLLETLEEALQARVIEELPNTVGRYQFTHALIQDTLQEELSTTRRARLHARIGEAFEVLYGDNVENYAAELAYHFSESVMVTGRGKLVLYSQMAGERALTGYAYEEALSHFERALAAREDQETNEETAALLFGLGRAQSALVQISDAIDNFGRAFDYYSKTKNVDMVVEIAASPLPAYVSALAGFERIVSGALALVPPDSIEEARLRANHGSILGLQQADLKGARQSFDRAISIARRENDLELEMTTLANSGLVELYHVQWDKAIKDSLSAIKLAERISSPAAEAAAHYTIAIKLWFQGETSEIQKHVDAGLAAAEITRDRSLLARTLWSREFVPYYNGDWKTVRTYSDRTQATLPTDARGLFIRTLMEFETGEFEQGDSYLQKLLDIMLNSPSAPNIEHAVPATTIAITGRITGNQEHFELAHEIVTQFVSSPALTPLTAHLGYISLGLIEVQRANAQGALPTYEELKRLGKLTPCFLIVVDRVLGLLAHTMGNLDDAQSHFDAALAFCRKAGHRPELAWSLCDYADMLLERASTGSAQADDKAKATAMLDESLAISTELGMRPLMERVLSRREILKA